MNKNPYLHIDQQITGDVYTATEVMDNLITLCDEFGSRFGGTEGERQAAQFLQAKMKAYGLQHVHSEPVEYLGWRRGTAKFEITHPVRQMLPCISLPHSPPTNLEGIIIDMGDGAPDDFDKRADEITGKIVLTNSEVSPAGVRRWIHRNEKLGRSIMAGATGFIFVNHYPGYGPATGGIGHNGQASLIPGISLSKEDGAFVQRLVKRHGEVKARLTTTDELVPMVSWNVVSELPGQEKTNEIVALGCHYDGHDISQGATDPASGVVAVLEAARALAKYANTLPRTVRFIFWGIEEIGLLGSKDYARQHENELDQIRFYLNMDAAGSITDKGIVLNEWPELAPLFERWSDEMALPFYVGQSVSAHSDHFPFLMAGVPTAGIGKVKRDLSGRGYGHTQWDTLDKTNITSLREAAVFSARLAIRIVTEETWPVSRRNQEAVAALFDKPEYQEEAEFREQLAAYYLKHS